MTTRQRFPLSEDCVEKAGGNLVCTTSGKITDGGTLKLSARLLFEH